MNRKFILLCMLAVTNVVVAQNVGIGTNAPSEKLHVVGGARVTSLSGANNRLVQSNATGVLSNIADGTNGQVLGTNGAGVLSWVTLPAGGITGVTAGNGLVGGGTTGTVTVDVVAVNGLTTNANDIRLGGALIQNTTITQGAFNMIYDVNGNGDFIIQDGGTRIFNVDASAQNVGVRIAAPVNMFHMTNGGVAVGATAMALYDNSGVSGVALNGSNTNATSGYNAIEGITNYNGTAFIPAGVFGLAIYNGAASAPTIGVRGASNEWQGTGVRGSRFNGGGPNTGWGGEFYDDLGYTGFLGTISDEKTKKNVTSIENATSLIMELNPVTYSYDLEKYPNMGLNTGLEYGFISQQVQSVLPEITKVKTFDTQACVEMKPNATVRNNNEEFIVMDYTRIIPILTKAVQEQQTVISAQQAEIELIKSELNELKAIIQGQNSK